MIFTHISLHCKLVPAKYLEYGYGLLNVGKTEVFEDSAVFRQSQTFKTSQTPTTQISRKKLTSMPFIIIQYRVRWIRV